jgi:predicted metal-dependent HD superfamily phosphohydrolase
MVPLWFPIEDMRMGVNDAPQWLISAFIRACVGAGSKASRADLEAAAHRLLARWDEPGRFHHNIKHLVDVLAKVDQLAEETHTPDLVRLAAWYHGAVFSSAPTSAYAQRGGEDETASAELAATELTHLQVPQDNVDRVQKIITGIARHRDASDVDVQALCDAELATLAVEPQRYAAYRRDVRAEYAHIPTRDYVTARIAILTKLLGRKQLFASPLGQPWEDPARQNLQAELQRLRGELEALPPEPVGDDASADGERTGEIPVGVHAEGVEAALAAMTGEIDMSDTSTRGIPRVPSGAGTFGRSTAEVVSAAKRDTAPIIKRHEKKTAEREEKRDLPGRS